ncbi:MAG TPA: hypothetical protein VJM33_15465 [Microthrixaceae bacterium]|nr:hypothetical protein [Microthrixaceae bacterium]
MDIDPTRDRACIESVLIGLSQGRGSDEIVADVAPPPSTRDLFPGEILLDLAADLIEASGATRDHPLDTEQIRRRLLPEDRAHTKAQHYKADFAIRAAAMIRAGVDPALIDNAARWEVNDLWLWSLQAVVIYARAAAEYADVTVSDICDRVAALHDIDL